MHTLCLVVKRLAFFPERPRYFCSLPLIPFLYSSLFTRPLFTLFTLRIYHKTSWNATSKKFTFFIRPTRLDLTEEPFYGHGRIRISKEVGINIFTDMRFFGEVHFETLDESSFWRGLVSLPRLVKNLREIQN